MREEEHRPDRGGGTSGAGAGIPEIPRIIAHRGASRDRPENTLPAFEEALRQGCDGIEIDLQLSRDGVPIVYHDETLARLGRPDRSIAHHPLSEILKFDAGAAADPNTPGPRVPTFAEVLEGFAGRTRLLVEIKIWGTAGHRLALLEAALRELKRAAANDRVFILCYDAAVLDACAALAPAVPRVLNLRPPERPEPEWRPESETLSAISASVRTLTPRFGAAVRRLGLPLMVFSCNTEAEVGRALAAGAAGIMTDRPGWLAGILRDGAGGR